jgi:glycerol-3-phosphate cytidylyltransferase
MRDEVVLVVGVFDLFHAGHVNLLRKARELGDRLVVVVNGDELTGSYKRRPIMPEDDRLAVVAACRFVDHAEISNDYSVRDVVTRHHVTKIVHGDDWQADSYKRQIRCDDAFLETHGVTLALVPYTEGISTSGLIEACAAQQRELTSGVAVREPDDGLTD